MRAYDGIVSRVISLAKLPGGEHRREVEKELRAHVDDIAEEARSQGYDEPAITRIVAMRFGKPQEVAAAFASVYSPERLARRVFGAALLMIASTVAVVVVIGSVQSIAAICTAASIVSAFRDIRWELLGFCAVTLGYCSLYAGERLFPASPRKVVLLSATLALGIAAGLACLIPQHAILPFVAFASAALGRLLQRVAIPLLWLAGTAVPVLIAWVLFSPPMPGWQFPWLVWLGLTVSCKALQQIVQLFERFVPREGFAQPPISA